MRSLIVLAAFVSLSEVSSNDCGFDCSGDCSSCTGWSSSDYCAAQAACEGNCGGRWCPGHSPPAPSPMPAPVPPPSPPVPSPPAPSPPAPSPDCPGGSLSACIGLCPSQDQTVYKICVDTCVQRCGDGPSPPMPTPLPTPPPTPPPSPEPVGERCASPNVPLDSKCEGCPPRYKGKLCASTTRYFDQTKGACGCGPSNVPPADWWTLQQFTAALNCKNLDPENPMLAWCPSQCGGCYRICSTGGQVQGEAAEPDVCRTFKVTNRCGDGYDAAEPYPYWCSNQLTWQECEQNPGDCAKDGNTNYFGYSAHFDLMDFAGQITDGLKWDNPEVTFEPVECSEWDGPSWDCECDSPFKLPWLSSETSVV